VTGVHREEARPAPVTAVGDSADVATRTARRPGSLRRTTSHDCLRLDGLEGPVTVDARGRDLVTEPDGALTVLDGARVMLVATYLKPSVLSVEADPPLPSLASLVGSNPFGGFRRRVGELLPDERAAHTVRFRLLSDLPAALLVSGRALRVARVPIAMSGRGGPPVDICAGWAAGGTAVTGMTDQGPPMHMGPQASPVAPADDPNAWHEVDPLPPHGTRRRRRLDLWESDGVTQVECHFRDSHVDEDGLETVVHEYGVHAGIDGETQRVLWCRADAGPLPYPECPGARASAARLEGVALADVAATVRDTFTGPSTCTHLSDTLRTMGDVATLVGALRS
jgi:hypothetical protein